MYELLFLVYCRIQYCTILMFRSTRSCPVFPTGLQGAAEVEDFASCGFYSVVLLFPVRAGKAACKRGLCRSCGLEDNNLQKVFKTRNFKVPRWNVVVRKSHDLAAAPSMLEDQSDTASHEKPMNGLVAVQQQSPTVATPCLQPDQRTAKTRKAGHLPGRASAGFIGRATRKILASPRHSPGRSAHLGCSTNTTRTKTRLAQILIPSNNC